MQRPYLEVTFHEGEPWVAYYSLPRKLGQRVHRSRQVADSLVVDWDRRGAVLGVEIVDPPRVSFTALNRVLFELGVPTLTRAEFRPLHAGAKARARDRRSSRSRGPSARRRASA